MPKLLLSLIATLCLGALFTQAQTLPEYPVMAFAIDVGPGCNIDMSSLSRAQSEAFDKRPKTVFQISARPTYFFCRHWGAYTDLRFNFFRLKKSDRIVDVLMPGLSKLRPSLTLGTVYRFERRRWQIQPRLGIGISAYGDYSSRSVHDGKEVTKKLSGTMWCADLGISFAYRTSRVCALFLDLNTMQPFSPAKYRRTTTADGATSTLSVDSHTWGRTLSISMGVRFQTSGRSK